MSVVLRVFILIAISHKFLSVKCKLSGLLLAFYFGLQLVHALTMFV